MSARYWCMVLSIFSDGAASCLLPQLRVQTQARKLWWVEVIQVVIVCVAL